MKSSKRRFGHIRIKPDWKWISTIFGVTIGISAAMSFLSGEILSAGSIALSFVVLAAIVLLGILFDIIGMAVTAAEEKPFHSMASKRMPEAIIAIRLIRRAERVSSFCNDVVGDICGVVSGSASAVIAARVIADWQPNLDNVGQLLMSALVAGLTVGGKAFGKSIAMNNATLIILSASKLIYAVKSVPKVLTRIFHRA